MITDLTKEECEQVLAAGVYAHVGCVDGDEPYVVPITYVYRDGAIYGYTHEGHKIEILRKNPKVCVQTEQIESASRWQSVMCWGLFEEVTDAKDMQEVKLLLADQHGASVLEGQATPVSPLVEHLHRTHDDDTVIYRVRPYRMTGRAEKA